jgi:cell volume regulation protein A
MAEINSYLFIGAFLVLASILASTLSARTGLPLLLVFLAVGMLAGKDGPGGIQFADFRTAFLIGNLALAVILLDGGLRTSLDTFRVALKPAAVLATWGVVLTAGLTGAAAAWLLDTSWLYGALIGAMVASTDAAAVFSLLRQGGIQLNNRVRSVLEIESGVNDPMAIFLVIALVEQILAPGGRSAADAAWLLGRQLGFGALAGLAGGAALAWTVARIRLAEGLFALLVGSGGLAVFAAVNYAGGSGFLAIYLIGLVVGNWQGAAMEPVLRPMDGLAWLAQAGMFLILGLLVSPAELVTNAGPALALALFLMLVARPLAAVTSLAPFRFGWGEMGFIAWTGLRGAVPIVLAVFPVMAGVPGARALFDAVFAVVVASLLIQGTSLGTAARRLGVVIPHRAPPGERRELYRAGKDVLELADFTAEPGAPIVGQRIRARLTSNHGRSLRPVLIIRAGRALTPEQAETVAAGDRIWLVCRPERQDRLARLFASEETEQGLATLDFFGEFALRGDIRAWEAAEAYGLPFRDDERDQSLGVILESRLGRPPVEGDRVAIGPHHLIAREMQASRVAVVGLKLATGGGG